MKFTWACSSFLNVDPDGVLFDNVKSIVTVFGLVGGEHRVKVITETYVDVKF